MQHSSRSLEQSIFETLAYFDVANFPLTAMEVYAWLWQPPKTTVLGVEKKLTELVIQGRLATHFGFYFFPGHEKIIEERRAAVVPSEQKFRQAQRAAKLIRWVPFLRAIFVCNSVASETAKPESDIDFFIIAEKDRVWIVRFFTNLVLRVFGLRTYGKKQRDRVCLSFFVDTAHLNIGQWRIGPEDIHLTYWLLQMLPLYDPDHWYKRFVSANQWTAALIPNAILTTTLVASRAVKRGFIANVVRTMGEAMWRGSYGAMIEKQARELQKMKIPASVTDKMNNADHGVVINDHIIKLHEHDTRNSRLQAWRARVKEMVPGA